jgi:hypothetical protein
MQTAAPPAIVVQLPRGAARRTIWVSRPAGAVETTEITVPRGTALGVMASIPGVAGVGVDTAPGPVDTCRGAGATIVCSRSQEPCPMPGARWRLTFLKRSGPAGPVRLVFRVVS